MSEWNGRKSVREARIIPWIRRKKGQRINEEKDGTNYIIARIFCPN